LEKTKYQIQRCAFFEHQFSFCFFLIHIVAQGTRCTRAADFLDFRYRVQPPGIRQPGSPLALVNFESANPIPGFAFPPPGFRPGWFLAIQQGRRLR
jgi:hypothetical protein